jgi:hypothetical protein
LIIREDHDEVILAYNWFFWANCIVVTAAMLAIANPLVGAAATIEEVAHCRAIPQRLERLDCFGSLKHGPKTKTQNIPAAKQDGGDADSPASAKQAMPVKTPKNVEQAAPANKDRAGSDKTTQTDPVTTSSIDRFHAARNQPLCDTPDSLAAMILAGLLTSNPEAAATPGCRAIPDDAKLFPLERSPSFFPFMRIIKVKIASPTLPELTSGFTIEIDR